MKKPRSQAQKLAFAKAQYALAVKRYKKRIEYETTLKFAETTGFDNISYKLKILPPNELMEQGIKRERGGKLVTIYGEEALRIQTQSLSRRASRRALNEQYKANYIQALTGTKSQYEFTDEQIEEIENLLNSVSDVHFELLVQRGALPDIYELYLPAHLRKPSDLSSEEKLISDIQYAVTFGESTGRPRVARGDIQKVRELEKTLSGHVSAILKQTGKY